MQAEKPPEFLRLAEKPRGCFSRLAAGKIPAHAHSCYCEYKDYRWPSPYSRTYLLSADVCNMAFPGRWAFQAAYL